MVSTPFRDTAQKISQSKDFITMSVDCGRVRSHGWWRNLVLYGAWNGPGNQRVGPPTPEALAGIAKLFGTSKRQVAEMIAADWYGVDQQNDLSPRVRRLGPLIDSLSEADADFIEQMIRRLAP